MRTFLVCESDNVIAAEQLAVGELAAAKERQDTVYNAGERESRTTSSNDNWYDEFIATTSVHTASSITVTLIIITIIAAIRYSLQPHHSLSSFVRSFVRPVPSTIYLY